MSFFKAPSWAQPQVTKSEQKDDDDLFSHKSSFLSIFKESAEREKRDKEHEERRRIRKEEKRKSSEKRKSDEGEKGELKKRRITSEEGNRPLAQIGLGQSVVDLSSDDEEPHSQQQLPVRRSPRNRRVQDVLSPQRHRDRLVAPIVFDDAPEDDIEITAIETRQVQASSEPEEDEDSDPEIAELRRKAREKARAKQQPPKASSSDTVHTPEPTFYTAPALDPVVKILITSELPNTNPLMVCRKLSQRLREVREMWCKKQGFSDEFASQVFLIHRGRKFWDSSTVKRLGLDADAKGRVFRVDDPSKEGVDQVHVEAVTPELFEELKAEKVRQERAASGVPDLGDEAAVDETVAESAPITKQKKYIRLVVKAKGQDDWKIQVTETTSIAKLLKLGKKQLGFAEDQNVYFDFDGERLDSNGTVGDTEIEDMDCVDMHLDA